MDRIHESWKELFNEYVLDIESLYDREIVYPPMHQVCKVFEMDVAKINVVLLGQDPYHNVGQATGLSFSVPDNVKIPPSLRNMYKELQIEFPNRKYLFTSGNLEKWFYNEGIFLLNSALSVVQHKPGSHLKLWEGFTDDIMRYIDKHNKHCVFLLLGKYAHGKAKFITRKNNIVLGTHPSPLSAHAGFFGSGVFTRVETILGRQINWQT